jgi:hypothetical protein
VHGYCAGGSEVAGLFVDKEEKIEAGDFISKIHYDSSLVHTLLED